MVDLEFCPHVHLRTSEGTSTGELLSTLRATDEIHQVDPRTWAVPSGASGFHLPGVRGGRDQRGRAGYSSIVKSRQVTEPCIARRSASPAKSRAHWASLLAGRPPATAAKILLDNLVGEGEQVVWDGQTKCSCGLEVGLRAQFSTPAPPVDRPAFHL